jgi:hypothetical protein
MFQMFQTSVCDGSGKDADDFLLVWIIAFRGPFSTELRDMREINNFSSVRHSADSNPLSLSSDRDEELRNLWNCSYKLREEEMKRSKPFKVMDVNLRTVM